ncbi:MAG: ATP-binding protein, partial [Muribaculaceae bacterium]|nr:ATP-binding protein [Muribaculaceae bacterium]
RRKRHMCIRDIFKNLYIDTTNWDWKPYPVLRLDLNRNKFADEEALDEVLDNLFRKWEKEYRVETIADQLSSRFENIIEAAYKHTGCQVVILVDEYDKPLVGNVNNDIIFEHYRTKLTGIYSNFKSSAQYIRLVFLTGVSRFSKLSVFSDLNNLKDITFSDDFADVCGITEKELLENFQPGIQRLASKRKVNFEDAYLSLKRNYDGYRFTPEGSDIYNPWSLLNAMSEARIGGYWNATGAATVIAEALKNAEVDLEKTLNARWSLDRLAGLDLRNADPTALLYQTGYLTIGNYDFENETVKLKVPNEEVKKGLFNDMLPIYTKGKRGVIEGVVADIIDAIRYGEAEKMMRNLDTYFASIPYDLRIEHENNFQNALYILLTLIGIDAKAEVHTSDGRIDLLIETPKYIYILELKYNASSDLALRQIEDKQYSRKFTSNSRKIFMIGVNFSSKTRRIQDWKIKTI